MEWTGRAAAVRDSRKTGLWPIELVMAMRSIRTITAERASVGSCSPHIEWRAWHFGAGRVARPRSASAKKGYNSIGDNSCGPRTCRNALKIASKIKLL